MNPFTSPPPLRPKLYHTSLVHSLSLTQLSYTQKTLLYVSSDGIIRWIEPDVEDSRVQEVAGSHGVLIGGDSQEVELVLVAPGEFICPGFIDTHTHAPQYPNMGMGQEYQLLEWLEKCTFPREAKFADEGYARVVYEEVIKRTLNAGTTTSSYFASHHDGVTRILADVAAERGQRALVGKCAMIANSPDFYREESRESSLADTLANIDYIRAMPSSIASKGKYIAPLVQPILTPRFALSCLKDHLHDLGGIAKGDPDLHIQTHLSENKGEIAYTLESFPGHDTYTEVYDKAGLLRKGTILAHCVWLSEEEMKLISERGAGVSHCPTSNMNLASGAVRVGKMLDEGIEVGLGSDCSGGYALGILPQIRNASMMAKLVAVQANAGGDGSASTASTFADKSLTIPMLFHMATLGGAKMCNLDKQVGNFEVGKEFDALRVKSGTSPNFFYRVGEDNKGDDWWHVQEFKEAVQRFLFVADDRDISDVWVRGRRVGGSSRI